MNGYPRQVSRALDEEHRATLDLLARVEQAFAQGGLAHGAELAKLLGAFGRHLEQELGRHFDFEERELFPRMSDAGDGDMAALLLEEHHAIHAVAGELLPLARAATAGTLDAAGWDALKRGALETVERLRAHIHKETMGLLPLVDELLDEDSDRDLAFAYRAS
jgi:iron-sulfur cluster repair protein YtfE (RIC family)